MKVWVVSSWGVACGIAEHAAQISAAVQQADSSITMWPFPEALDPQVAFGRLISDRPQLIWLDHHDALHARWTPEHVQRFTAAGLPVVVTYHDTRSGALGAENSEKLKAFAQVASSVVVHEPVEDVKAIYWRQGVPAAAQAPVDMNEMRMGHDGSGFKAFPQQPVLGTVGFNFPWKNYDRLAQLTGEEGWALVILSNDATEADEARWRGMNSAILVVRKFLPQPEAINYLAGCDATVFMYECSNNGTSGAIRQGIAARKPVYAHTGCRQFRDLIEDDLGYTAIWWVENWENLRAELRQLHMRTVDVPMHALATRDSWAGLGKRYAELYRILAGDRA